MLRTQPNKTRGHVFFRFLVIGSLIAASGVSARAMAGNTIPLTWDFGNVSVNGGGSALVPLQYSFSGLTSQPNFSFVSGRDFKTNGPSCTVAATVSCSLPVTFQPSYPGIRQDAVIVKDQAGNTLGSTLLHGIGQGPEAVIYPGVITTYAGTGNWSYSGDTQLATAATFRNPHGVAVDAVGNLFIADSVNQVVREVSIATGTIATVAGMPLMAGYSGDGGPATEATLNNPAAVAIDGAGNLYIADQGNNVIRKVTAASGIITTVAGGAHAASGADGLGDGGSATNALLNGPSDVTLDAAANLYIADAFHGLIRRVDAASGVITAVAGGGSAVGTDGFGDGAAAIQARLNDPTGIAVDASGNLYIADTGHSLVRFVNTSTGLIAAIAGNGSAGYNGDLGPAAKAELNAPSDVRVDAAGNVYVVDLGNNAIRKVEAASGTINTIAGNGAPGYYGDHGISTGANLRSPAGLAFDSAGNLYIADEGNNVIRKVAFQSRAMSFGSTNIGLASPVQLVSVENIGNSPLNFSAVTVSPNFRQQPSGYMDCSASSGVAPGSNCTIGIAFVPSTTSSLTGSLTVITNTLNVSGALPVATLNGAGVFGPVPNVALSAASLVFGNHVVGLSTTPTPVIVTNSGTAPLGFSGIWITGTNAADFSIATTCGAVLAVQASCTVAVEFVPSAVGVRSATLIFNDSVASSPQSVTLAGAGVLPARASLDASSLTFSGQTIGSSSVSQSLILTSSGGVPLSISAISLSGQNAADFKLSTTCPGVLTVGSTCKTSVTFAPSAPGERTALLGFASSDANSPRLVVITGTGVGTPKITVSPLNLNFGNQVRGSKATQSVFITNSGTGALPIASIAVTGKDAAVFSIVNNTCGSNIDVGGGCTLTVAFSPLLRGSQAAAVAIISSPATGWQVPLGGTGRGQAKGDFAVWRPGNGTWFVTGGGGSAAAVVQQWGLPGDVPVRGDYDGDGRPDFAVWRRSTGTWFLIPSGNGVAIGQQWGLPGDIPVPGDYDGDGKTDFAVWRPSNGTWFVIPSDGSGAYSQQWGLPGDIPVPGDYDGDGKTDFAVWRPSNGTWFVIPSSHPAGTLVQQWGLKNDIPITKDFDGDGKSDLCVWRPSNGSWYVLAIGGLTRYPTPTIFQQWGLPGDIPQ